MNSLSLAARNAFSLNDDMPQKPISASDNSDEGLMLAYSDGCVKAFERLYSRHKAPLYRYFLRQTSSRDLAEELFQDVWLKIVNARDSYQQSAKFTTYLYRIAHNRLIDHYRHLSSAQYRQRFEGDNQAEVESYSESLSSTQVLATEELAIRLKQAINDLPFEQREAFLMQQEGQLSLEDIAVITETTRETVKSRLRYATNKLRTQLGDLQS